MRYFSTRNDKIKLDFIRTILKGIASDGGLLVPEKIPEISFDDIKNFTDLSYQELSQFIYKLFEVDFLDEVLDTIVNSAYLRFDTTEVAPLVHLKDNQYILELFHGPTSAFKDMALQIMPLFFQESVKIDNTEREKKGEKPYHYLILVATSGDTGTAALEGFKNREGIDIIVVYPKNGVSDLQEKQMVTQDGSNQFVFGIHGNFDDGQTMVKTIFTDTGFENELDERGIKLSSANSINWGRLLPQIVYYIRAYTELLKKGVIKKGDYIDVTVPTGNFGNILAAYYAKEMGVPIDRLVCASNTNNVLYDFLLTGEYDLTKRELIKTPSPSMDILISSNLERLLYQLSGDTDIIKNLMNKLKENGNFKVDKTVLGKLQENFFPGWVDNNKTIKNIKKVFDETGYLMDPHTSVGQKIAEDYIKENGSSKPMVIASTAHWAKFGLDVYKALNDINYDEKNIPEIKNMTGVDIIMQISDKFGLTLPENLASLNKKPVFHNKVLDKDVKMLKNKIKDIYGI